MRNCGSEGGTGLARILDCDSITPEGIKIMISLPLFVKWRWTGILYNIKSKYHWTTQQLNETSFFLSGCRHSLTNDFEEFSRACDPDIYNIPFIQFYRCSYFLEPRCLLINNFKKLYWVKILYLKHSWFFLFYSIHFNTSRGLKPQAKLWREFDGVERETACEALGWAKGMGICGHRPGWGCQTS